VLRTAECILPESCFLHQHEWAHTHTRTVHVYTEIYQIFSKIPAAQLSVCELRRSCLTFVLQLVLAPPFLGDAIACSASIAQHHASCVTLRHYTAADDQLSVGLSEERVWLVVSPGATARRWYFLRECMATFRHSRKLCTAQAIQNRYNTH
jgi:hypothetical protein